MIFKYFWLKINTILFNFEEQTTRIMKTKILLFFMFIAATASAQITVDSTSIITPGNTRYMAFDDTPASTISEGTASATAQTWDFSDLVANDIDTLNFVAPANATYPPTVPDANLTLDLGDMSLHLRNEASGLYLLEAVGAFGTFPVFETWANFPMTYGSNFNWSFVFDTVVVNTFIPMPGADLIRYKKDTFNISEVDAFGTAITPLGTFDVLRLTSDASSIDSIWTKAFQVSHQVQTSGMTFDPDTLSISVLDTVFFSGLGNHDVTEVDQATYLANGNTSNGGFTYLMDTFHIFTEPGTYYYVCSPHANMGMKGMITVVDDWTFFQTSSNAGDPSYAFWADNANDVGMPLVTLYSDGAEFLNNGSVATPETWDCIAGACVDPGDGTGYYDNLGDCQYVCVSSGIEESNNQTLLVYPNPANDFISFNTDYSGTLNIYGVDGKEVVNKQISPNATINIADLAEGMYHYRFISDMEIQSGTFQIIK